jgi:hypothetical protein
MPQVWMAPPSTASQVALPPTGTGDSTACAGAMPTWP